MKKIIQVLGPTGVGKSKVAVTLAQRIDGEIISADSMQVYKDFDIGTDKLSPVDRGNIPHHLVDILSDCSQFNAAMFLERSYALSEEIIRRGRVPIVCGGTAFYLKTMIKGIFPECQGKTATRENLEREMEQQGLPALWERLNQVDPGYAQKIGKNDKIRIIRALEIYYNHNLPPSELFRKTRTPFKEYELIRVGLTLPREQLYRRIERRVEEMMGRGFLEEVKGLKEKYPPGCPPFKSVGYKEILMYLNNQLAGLGEAVELIKQHSRNFAKRQLSWFRQEKDIRWYDPRQEEEIVGYAREKLDAHPEE